MPHRIPLHRGAYYSVTQSPPICSIHRCCLDQSRESRPTMKKLANFTPTGHWRRRSEGNNQAAAFSAPVVGSRSKPTTKRQHCHAEAATLYAKPTSRDTGGAAQPPQQSVAVRSRNVGTTSPRAPARWLGRISDHLPFIITLAEAFRHSLVLRSAERIIPS